MITSTSFNFLIIINPFCNCYFLTVQRCSRKISKGVWGQRWEPCMGVRHGRKENRVRNSIKKKWGTYLVVQWLWHRAPKAGSQFSSVAQSCPTLCDPMNCSTPGLPVHHQLLELPKPMSIESVMPSNHLILCCPFSSCPQSLPASGSFPMSQLFTSGGQSIGVSASNQSFKWTLRTDFL